MAVVPVTLRLPEPGVWLSDYLSPETVSLGGRALPNSNRMSWDSKLIHSVFIRSFSKGSKFLAHLCMFTSFLPTVGIRNPS